MIRQTIFYVLSFAVGGIGALGVLFQFTHSLSPSEYGIYSLVLSSAGIFNAAFFQWIKLYILRFRSSQAVGRDKFVFDGFILKAFFATLILGSIIGFGAHVVFPEIESLSYIRWTIGAATCIGALDTSLAIARGENRPRFFLFLTVFRFATTFAASYIVLNRLPDHRFAIICYGLGCLVPAIFTLIREICDLRAERQADTAVTSLPLANRSESISLRKMAVYGVPVSANGGLSLINTLTDRYVVAGILGATILGGYAAAFDLANQIISGLMIALNMAAFGELVKRRDSGDKKSLDRQIRVNTLTQCVMPLPVLFIGGVFSTDIAKLIFPIAYAHVAGSVMPFMLFSVYLTGIKAFVFEPIFQLELRGAKMLIPTIVAFCSNMALLFLLAKIYGTIGAVFGQIIASCVALVVSGWLLRKRFPFFEMAKDVVPLFPVLVIFIAAVLASHLQLLNFFEKSMCTLIFIFLLGYSVYKIRARFAG